jgi:hypothetical protein
MELVPQQTLGSRRRRHDAHPKRQCQDGLGRRTSDAGSWTADGKSDDALDKSLIQLARLGDTDVHC